MLRGVVFDGRSLLDGRGLLEEGLDRGKFYLRRAKALSGRIWVGDED